MRGMRREYKIIKTFLWYNLYKKGEVNWFTQLWFLYKNKKRGLNKDHAQVFYNKEAALSALVIMKRKDEWEKSD